MTWSPGNRFVLQAPDLNQRRRVRSGAQAEDLVELLNLQCANAGIAWIRKLPTPWKIIDSCSRGQVAVPEKKSGVDYVGHMADGRAVYVEAKRCTVRRFPMSRVPPHQASELRNAAIRGCVSVLLIVYGERQSIYAVPWEWLGYPYGVPTSLTPEWLDPFYVPPGIPYLKRWVR